MLYLQIISAGEERIAYRINAEREMPLQTVNAAMEIVENMYRHPYGILNAPMQSGKTETYKLAGCEMVRNGVVDRIVIFSGLTEIDLRAQTKNNSVFSKKYRKYLRDQLMSVDDAEEICDHCVDTIEVIWGQDLDAFVPNGRTFYIWEESHYGQTKDQRVDKFLRKCGIQATGTIIETGCFMLSVSATPFSELSDLFHLDQQKWVVRLIPGDNYISIEKMFENGQIHSMINSTDELRTILPTFNHGYGIIRAITRKREALKRIAIENGCAVIYCDREHCDKIDINSILGTRPERPTIVFIKQTGRLGKNLDLTHVRFGMETSVGCKTDTLIQSLIGRVCGYKSRPDIQIYVMNLNMSEMNKVISLFQGDYTSIPQKANNIVDVLKGRVSIIPLRIPILSDEPHIDVLYAIENGIQNHNSLTDTPIILRILKRIATARGVPVHERTEEDKNLSSHFKIHERGLVYNASFPKVKEAFEMKTHTSEFGSGAGAAAKEDEIVVWKDATHLYITMQIENELSERVPFTTKREVFCSENIPVIGGFTLNLRQITKSDKNELERTLMECITLSRDHSNVFHSSTKLTSNGFDVNCIHLSPDVFQSLSETKSKFARIGITLSWKKMAGRKLKGLPNVERLSEISWS
jgi:hypothetical protein